MNETVLLDIDHGVATVTLNRPEAANAIDLPTARALGDVVDRVAADPDVRAVLVVGAGSRFCAGGDVGAMVGATDRAVFIEELADALDGALQRLEALEKPVVAAVQGAVAGAGLAVMLSCDLVLAAAGTKLVTAYAGVGLTPDCGLSWLLPRAVGQQRALELLLTPRVLGADEAVDWGLVAQVVDPAALGDRSVALARQLADGPAYALGQARRLVRGSWESSRAAVGADEAGTIARAVVQPEAERLLARFVGR